MFFHIFDFGIFANKKSVNTVVLRVLLAAVVNAAAGNNYNIAVFANEKVIINRFRQAAVAEHNRYVDTFVDRVGLNVNINAAAVCFRYNFNVCAVASTCQLAIYAKALLHKSVLSL